MHIGRPIHRYFALPLLALLLLGCPGRPPTDALQAAENALQRARDAYAEDCAGTEFRAAQRLLEQAQQASAQGDYDRALTLAQAAEEQAERARLTSQANWDDCDAARAAQAGTTDQDYTAQGERDRFQVVATDYDLVPIYFGFDESVLDAGARETIENHARYFNTNNYTVVIEGHCDAQGTDQYNLALGERRARAVAQYLVTLGVEQQRIRIISYGEFRPISQDDRLNRRAEFKLRVE
ncbi:MAG: OmpA family protein [Bradymonadales bacterium]|nr:OmpA family protein [Bradymonadales bacterium]